MCPAMAREGRQDDEVGAVLACRVGAQRAELIVLPALRAIAGHNERP